MARFAAERWPSQWRPGYGVGDDSICGIAAKAFRPGEEAGMNRQPSGELPEAGRSSHRLGARVANSAALLWALQMLVRGSGFVTLIVLARVLTPADFGIVALATTIIGVLDVLTNVQVGAAIIRSNNLTAAHLDTAFTLNLLRGLLTAAVLAAFARPLAMFLDAPDLEAILYVLVIPSILGAINNPHFILYGRNLDFRKEAQRRIAATLLGSMVAIVIALVFRTYWALIAAAIVQSMVLVVLSYWKIPGRPRWSLAKRHELLGFGGWLLVQNLLSYLALRLEYFYIGKLMDARTLGAYHLGNQVNSMSTADVIPALSRALFPALSILSDDSERLRRAYLQMQTISLTIALPIGFGLALMAEPLILLLFGRGWETAVLVVWFITPIAALQAVGAGVEALAMALNKVRVLAARSAIYVTVRTVTQLIGFVLGGLLGLLIGRAVAGIFQSLYGLALAAHLTRRSLWEPIIASWRSFVSIGSMCAGLLVLPGADYALLPWLELLAHVTARITLGAILYAGTHLLLWCLQGRPDGVEAFVLRRLARFVPGHTRG